MVQVLPPKNKKKGANWCWNNPFIPQTDKQWCLENDGTTGNGIIAG